MPVAMLAALHSGRVFAPIATDYPEVRQRRILQAIEPGCLLVDNTTAALVPECACPIVNSDEVNIDALNSDEVNISPHDQAAAGRTDPNKPALIVFTSGSTGEPLGVVHSEANLVAHGLRSVRALQIDPSDRLSMLSRGIHISGVTDIVRSIVSGAALMPVDVAALDIDTASADIRDAAVSVLHCTPSLAATLFDATKRSVHFETVRLIHLGGEALSADTLAACQRSLPTHAVVVNQLGCTELSGFCQAFLRTGAVQPQGPVPAGFPVEGVTVRILDDQGHPVAENETGRIVIAGEGLALGYWNEPSLTAAVFHEGAANDPRYFLTGDRGRWLPDGQIEYRGRIDHQVQVRGYRVELAEIEIALKQLETITDAVVVAPRVEPGETDSGTDVGLVAHLVPAGGSVDVIRLKQRLVEALPSYMHPSRYVVHESLPRTPSGKVDRSALAAMSSTSNTAIEDIVASPVCPAPPYAGDQDSIAVIKSVWSETLGLHTIGDDDDFFGIGGDSLQAMRVCSRLLSFTGSEISLRDLFDAPTPRGLASLLTAEKSAARRAPAENDFPYSSTTLNK